MESVPPLCSYCDVASNDAADVFFLTTPAEHAAHGDAARGVSVPKSDGKALSPFLTALDSDEGNIAVVPCEGAPLCALRLVAWYLISAGKPCDGDSGSRLDCLGAALLPRPFEQDAVHDASCLSVFERSFAAAVFGPLAAQASDASHEVNQAAPALAIGLLRVSQLLQVTPLSLLCGCAIAVRWNAVGGAAAASAVTADAVALLEVSSGGVVSPVDFIVENCIAGVEAVAAAPPPGDNAEPDGKPRPPFPATVTSEPMADVETPGINAVPRAECIDPFVTWSTSPIIVQWEDGLAYAPRGTIVKSARVTYDYTACDLPEVPAWQHCGSHVGTLIFPASVTSVGEGAFLACHAVVDLSQCTQLTHLSKEAFSSFEGSVTFPPSITSMEELVFSQCKASVDLSHCVGLALIPDKAFESFEGDEIRLPPSIESLGERSFSKCMAKSVDLSECLDLTHLEDEAFASVRSGRLTMPPSLESTGFNVFANAAWPVVIDLSRCPHIDAHETTFYGMESGTVIVHPETVFDRDPHRDVDVEVADV